MLNPRKVFTGEDFRPGEVVWNGLTVDPDQPLVPQMDEFSEEPIFVRFPNGCSLDVEWRGPETGGSCFVVSLNQTLIGHGWEPFDRRECGSIPELVGVVRQMVQIARERPSLPTELFTEERAGSSIYVNDLVLDQTLPPERQVDRLKDWMLEMWLGPDGRILTVGWEPPHDSNGKFVVRVGDYPLGDRLDDNAAGRPPQVRWLTERRCRTIPELKRLVGEMASEFG